MKKHIICLSQEQRQALQQIVKAGTVPARQILQAQILLKVDAGPEGPNWSNKQIREAFGAVESTIWRVRTRFLAEGLPSAVARRKQPERPEKRKLQGEQEAHLIALACQTPPDGREHWTLRLLADKLVALEIVSSVSHETVRTTLKKTNSSPGKSRNGAFRPKRTRPLSQRWKMCSRSTTGPMMRGLRKSVWMRSANNC
ncbi:MAG TPA: helix-turn-helix domain-containing protein [Ktedonobacteraceae bacterium]|nr:helix-turn-helix domain-containing protein [Ktedonobacteraceae bacterium]